MTRTLQVLLLTATTVPGGWEVSAQDPQGDDRAVREDHCVQCHAEKELWEDEALRLLVTEADFVDDIHWQKGLRCHDCHGGDPTTVDFARAHAIEAGYRPIRSPADIPEFCGHCHAKIFGLFSRARMKHRFEAVGLPGCATCHGNHDIRSPSDEMLGMGPRGVCAHCHSEGEFGAPSAGAKVAFVMRSGLEQLKSRIAQADEKLSLAERLGMETRGPRFDLRKAFNALTNARTSMHGFALDPMKAYLDEGIQVADMAIQDAEEALREHTKRRIWLGMSLLPLLVIVLLLLLTIRRLPPPIGSDHPTPPR